MIVLIIEWIFLISGYSFLSKGQNFLFHYWKNSKAQQALRGYKEISNQIQIADTHCIQPAYMAVHANLYTDTGNLFWINSRMFFHVFIKFHHFKCFWNQSSIKARACFPVSRANGSLVLYRPANPWETPGKILA